MARVWGRLYRDERGFFIVRRPALQGGGGENLLFEADPSSPPLFGFSAQYTDIPQWTPVRVAGAGPGGRDVIQATHNPRTLAQTITYGTAQYYWGWTTPAFASRTFGQSLFCRMYFCTQTVSNPDSWDEELGGGSGDDNWYTKFQIIGAESGAENRFIMMLSPVDFPASTYAINFCRNIDNPPAGTSGWNVAAGTYVATQWELRASSAWNVADGIIKAWFNTDTYESPSSVSDPMVINTRPGSGDADNWIQGSLGSVTQSTLVDGLSPAASVVFRIAAFEIGTSFDTGWAGRM